MSTLDWILNIGMPIITIILIALILLIKDISKDNKNLVWGVVISLGLYSIALILHYTEVFAQPFLMWSQIALPLGTLLVYLGLKK